MRSSLLALLTVLLAALLTAPAAAETPPRVYNGTIDGAEYLVKVPHDWNGTLVVFSHGYYPDFIEFPVEGIALSTADRTADWLLDHGYALAASNFRGVTGLAVEPALRDQVRLLDWFEDNVGHPRRTISSGMSMGGAIAVLLAERNPHRFDGVLAQCAEFDMPGTWNISLDVHFAVRTLLTDGTADLVHARNPQATVDTLHAGIEAARADKPGLAKLALVAALGNLPGWISAHDPAPTGLWDRIRAQADWVDLGYVQGSGTLARTDLERRAGGNPSWNTGIDYRHQLAISGKVETVRQAYREAGADLDADLAALNAAPRVKADPRAAAYLHRYVASGRTPAPVVTLHNPADGGTIADQVGWYAGLTDDSEVRHLWSDRGNHCAFSAAEEVTALHTLERKIDSGRWPATRPDTLNSAALELAPEYHVVRDIITWSDKEMPPVFVRFSPDTFQRPSR